MALRHELKWKTKQEMFEAIANVYGRFEPRDPIPEWWEFAKRAKYPDAAKPPPDWWPAFEAFFTRHPDGCALRTEPFEISDDDDW
jgi:hypothetical protein